MKKISKEHKLTIAALVEELEKKAELIGKANEVVAEAVAEYNEALEKAREFRDEIVGAMQEYHSERSEKWQEGDAGSAYQEWIDAWEAMELDELPEPDEIDIPEHAAEIEQGPHEPDGV